LGQSLAARSREINHDPRPKTDPPPGPQYR
jgi:hypothetical protein